MLAKKLDPLISKEDGTKNAKLTANSRFEIVDKMGHMFFNQEIEKKIVGLLLSHFFPVL